MQFFHLKSNLFAGARKGKEKNPVSGHWMAEKFQARNSMKRKNFRRKKNLANFKWILAKIFHSVIKVKSNIGKKKKKYANGKENRKLSSAKRK